MYNIITMFSKTFRGGVHPAQHKEVTVDKRIKAVPAPPEIILPLTQHIGAPNEPLLGPGDTVKLGQRIAGSESFISAPVHSSVSGKIKTIQNFFNPVYGKAPAAFIENDGRNEAVPFQARENPLALPKEKLISIVREAGIVGLGGAAFPTHVKLKLPEGKNADSLIANGAECEPYLTCDHRLMVERTDKIIKGIYLAAGILGVKNIFLAVEQNKLSAVFAIEKAVREITRKSSHSIPLRIKVLKTKYPQGGEKQLVKAILGREVPPGKLPLDVGAVVQNVGTCLALYEAVYDGKPLIERCITLSGSCLREPGNFIVRLGTPLRDAVKFCGGFTEPPAKVIVGGPMMGIAQYTLDIPIVKGTTGVVFLSKKETEIPEELSCVRCARCVDICPVNLLPTEIMRMVKYSRWHRTEELHPSDCIECGACAYACLSKIPLVQYIKLAKQKELKKK